MFSRRSILLQSGYGDGTGLPVAADCVAAHEQEAEVGGVRPGRLLFLVRSEDQAVSGLKVFHGLLE